MERSVTTIGFPQTRSDVMEALAALADVRRQEAIWGQYDAQAGTFEDLTLWVNLLLDCRVLPDPADAVGSVLRATEVPALERLARVLWPMVEEFGASRDAVYQADDRWPQVVTYATGSLRVMEADPP
jgi:hypothetical protein